MDRDLKHLDETTRLRIEALDKQIKAQDVQIERFLSWAGWVGLIVALIATFTAVAAYISAPIQASRQALAAVETWLDKHGPEVLERLKEETQQKMDRRLGKLEGEVDSLLAKFTRELETLFERAGELIAERKEEEVSPADKAEIDRAARDAKAKPDPEKMYPDWFSMGIDAFLDDDYLRAAESFNHAARSKEATSEQTARALFNKGLALGEAKRLEEAIGAYDDIVQRFGDAEEPALREQVAMALCNKGVDLGKAEKFDDEIAAYDEVVRRFGEALAYVRNRYRSSDYVRMERQRCMLRSIAAQADFFTLMTRFSAIAGALRDSARTNIPVELLPELIRQVSRLDFGEIETIAFQPGYYAPDRDFGRYPIPDADRIQQKVQSMLRASSEGTTGGGSGESECD